MRLIGQYGLSDDDIREILNTRKRAVKALKKLYKKQRKIALRNKVRAVFFSIKK